MIKGHRRSELGTAAASGLIGCLLSSSQLPNIYIPSYMKSVLMLWQTKYIWFALVYFDPRKYILVQTLQCTVIKILYIFFVHEKTF